MTCEWFAVVSKLTDNCYRSTNNNSSVIGYSNFLGALVNETISNAIIIFNSLLLMLFISKHLFIIFNRHALNEVHIYCNTIKIKLTIYTYICISI